MSGPEVFEWFWKIAVAATPFMVLYFNLRAGSKTNERKALMESIDGKINTVDGKINAAVGQVAALSDKVEGAKRELSVRIENGNASCRENVEAVQRQVQAFQLDVANRYPTRGEFAEQVGELRDEFRHYYSLRRTTRSGEGG